MLHLILHLLVPLAVALLYFGVRWKKAFAIFIATMLVDLDHLLATPIYDAGRCSIGFHPLHELWFIGIYIAMCFVSKLRLVGIGLVIHMLLDSVDCQVTSGVWMT